MPIKLYFIPQVVLRFYSERWWDWKKITGKVLELACSSEYWTNRIKINNIEIIHWSY